MLGLMQEDGKLSPEEFDNALAADLTIVPPAPKDGDSRWYLDYISRELAAADTVPTADEARLSFRGASLYTKLILHGISIASSLIGLSSTASDLHFKRDSKICLATVPKVKYAFRISQILQIGSRLLILEGLDCHQQALNGWNLHWPDKGKSIARPPHFFGQKSAKPRTAGAARSSEPYADET